MPRRSDRYLSSLTVGICACSEVESTIRLVNTFLTSSSGQENRVIVVTPSELIAEKLHGKKERISVILERTREGKAAAMNKMLRAVSGGILVYASADTRIDKEVIPSLVEELLSDPRNGAVIAHVVPVNQEGIMGKVSSFMWKLFNHTSQRLDAETELAQADDLYAFWRDLVGEIPLGTINDDAYIASTIRRKGFLVKKADVCVRISGPTTPMDYLTQRSRVILGYLQTIKIQGVIPTVFEFTFLSSPAKSFGIFKKVIAESRLQGVIGAFFAVQLELLSWTYALLLRTLRIDVRIWKIASGTKRV